MTSTKAIPTTRSSAAKSATERRKAVPAATPPAPISQLTDQLKELRLPTIRDEFQKSAIRAATENLSHLAYLSELTTMG